MNDGSGSGYRDVYESRKRDRMAETKIEWRVVPGWEMYRVSNTGRVQSRVRRIGRGRGLGTAIIEGRVWKERKLYVDSRGYHIVTFGRGVTKSVHRLVLEAFVGECPIGMECRHIDGNALNNQIDNLTWGTPTENQADQVRHGTRVKGERHPQARLTDEEVAQIRSLYQNSGWSQKEIAGEFQLAQGHVSQLVNRKVRDG